MPFIYDGEIDGIYEELIVFKDFLRGYKRNKGDPLVKEEMVLLKKLLSKKELNDSVILQNLTIVMANFGVPDNQP
jgi:hypothetical protein